ncbi:hypothetical protein Tco_1143901 [Tanacetum coccineum]
MPTVSEGTVGFRGSWFQKFAKKESMKKAFQDMLHELGEVNPTHAYYNGSCTIKDTEDIPKLEYKFLRQGGTQKESLSFGCALDELYF